jgi:hypothetical protein
MPSIELPEVELIVFVTRQYHWLVEPLLYMYRRDLDVSLTFFSDRPIEGCNAIEVFPRDMRLYQESCGYLIKDALREIDKSLVAFLTMDILPTGKVDVAKLQQLMDYMLGNERVSRGHLCASYESQIKNCEEVLWSDPDLSIVKIPYMNQHIGQLGATSLTPALWRRDFLLEFIEDGWTWDNIELPGCNKFMAQAQWYSRWYAIGTIPCLLPTGHLCYTSDKRIVRISNIPNEEDRAFVTQFAPGWAKLE